MIVIIAEICFFLFCFRQRDFIFSNTVIAILFQHLLHRIFGDVYERELLIDADLANGVARDIRMERDRTDHITRADAVQLAFVQLHADHALFMR